VAGLTGLVVSVLELACTGQLYLPTLLFVQGEPGLRAHALSYLVLYNVFFVVPLIVVFVVAALGVSSARLAGLVQRHTGTVKLLTAIVFAVLGAFLFGTVV
jgi:threonine/homoserine/homoserine lactone efflux protein